MNQALAIEVIEACWRAGVRTVCLCPGGRNAPLVEALEPLRAAGMSVLDFFDENSAGFFALGRARRDGSPVAVVTTSGTAAAELLPAVVEAYYQGGQLLVVTADRPPSYRGTGAPQSIEQVGLFGVYTRQAIDLDRAGEPWGIDSCCWPVHLNVCFDEPLLGDWTRGQTASLRADAAAPQAAPSTSRPRVAGGRIPAMRHPLIVLGALATVEDREAAQQFCSRVPAPVLAEASSHLRHRLAGVLRGGEAVAAAGLRRGWLDGVIRIGDVPSFRVWRDLETLRDLPVLSVSRLPWAGLTRGVHLQARAGEPLPLDSLGQAVEAVESPVRDLELEDERVASGVERLLRRFPRSEPASVRDLSRAIPPRSLVYLGNSLPIREWNQFAVPGDFRYGENRGANGIDGQLSTFLGWSGPGRDNWALVGDLTALYDLASPWALQHAAGRVRIVVINNGGGRIFRRMFGNQRFQNGHALGFDMWARMWGLAYSNDACLLPESEPVVVELRPDQEETDRFWAEHEKLVSGTGAHGGTSQGASR